MMFFILQDFIRENRDLIYIIKNQYLELLSMLTNIEYMSENKFLKKIDDIHLQGKIFICCIGSIQDRNFKIVGSGTIFIEHKIIHAGKSVGHIEDIVVHEDYRGMGISQKILDLLKNEALENNCYKVILDCKESLCHFYEKNGFSKRGTQMGIYYN